MEAKIINMLHDYRRRHGLSRYGLADRIGVSESAVRRLEQGVTYTGARAVRRIEAFLQAEMENSQGQSQPESLGARVLDYRRRHRLSQKALAMDIGIHADLISRMERGKFSPTAQSTRRICAFLAEEDRREREGSVLQPARLINGRYFGQ